MRSPEQRVSRCCTKATTSAMPVFTARIWAECISTCFFARPQPRHRNRLPTWISDQSWKFATETSGGILITAEVSLATTTRVPIEVYLRSSFEPDAEYVDGQI